MDAGVQQTRTETKFEEGDGHLGQLTNNLDIRLEGKKLKQGDSFVFFGGGSKTVNCACMRV